MKLNDAQIQIDMNSSFHNSIIVKESVKDLEKVNVDPPPEENRSTLYKLRGNKVFKVVAPKVHDMNKGRAQEIVKKAE